MNQKTTANIQGGGAIPHLLTFKWTERQGFSLYMDDIYIGYFSADGFATLSMMYLLQLLTKASNVEFRVTSNEYVKLTDWINARIRQ